MRTSQSRAQATSVKDVFFRQSVDEISKYPIRFATPVFFGESPARLH